MAGPAQRVNTVVIGNGPSSIVASYLLSGWTPYLQPGAQCGEELLQMRLDYCFQESRSLLDKDFDLLTDGLEGRSSNPTALLFDKLVRPQADLNRKKPSLLEWRLDKQKAVDHVVIGKGEPGGSWQFMPEKMETLSAAAWLELPEASFSDWMAGKSFDHLTSLTSNPAGVRPTASLVQQYYYDYVTDKAMRPNFVNNTVITSVTRVPCESQSCCPQGPIFDQDTGEIVNEEGHTCHEWEIIGHHLDRANDAGAVCENGCCSTGCYGNGCHSYTECKESQCDQLCVSDTADEDIFACDNVNYGHNFHGDSACRQGSSDTNIQNAHRHGSCCSDGSRDSGCHSNVSVRDNCSCVCTNCTRRCSKDSPHIGEVRWRARNIVLACGTYDTPNVLHIPGEALSFVRHATAATLDAALAEAYVDTPLSPSTIPFTSPRSPLSDSLRMSVPFSPSDPILIIGAGLTAADAILDSLARGLRVVHLFGRSASDPSIVYGRLPALVYPRYHSLLAAMKGEMALTGYTPLASHRVVEIMEDKRVIVEPIPHQGDPLDRKQNITADVNKDSVTEDTQYDTEITRDVRSNGELSTSAGHALSTTSSSSGSTRILTSPLTTLGSTADKHIIEVSLVYACIGSQCDLSFLPARGIGLGVTPDLPVDCKRNPVAVQSLTHESVSQPCLYALGPLVGDNFVRFGQGGAVAAARHLRMKRKKNE